MACRARQQVGISIRTTLVASSLYQPYVTPQRRYLRHLDTSSILDRILLLLLRLLLLHTPLLCGLGVRSGWGVKVGIRANANVRVLHARDYHPWYSKK